MKEFLRKLGITQAGYFSSSGNFVIDFEKDLDLARIYSLLDKSDLVEESDDDSFINQNNMYQVFTSDEYQLTLLSDFDSDRYQLVVRELK